MKKKGVRRHGGIFAVSSGCDNAGGHGVELWVNSESVAMNVDGKDVFVTPRCVSVLTSSPTLIIVMVQCLDLLLCFTVAHAPNTKRGKKAIEAWWDRFMEAHSAAPPFAIKIVCIDGNCRLGSEQSDGVGNYNAQQEDTGGARMRAFLDRYGMWAPQTFSGIPALVPRIPGRATC